MPSRAANKSHEDEAKPRLRGSSTKSANDNESTASGAAASSCRIGDRISQMIERIEEEERSKLHETLEKQSVESVV